MQFSAEYSRITVSVCRTDLLQNIAIFILL